MITSRTTPSIHLPRFDGFPYLTTRIVPALYHISLLQAGVTEADLIEIARAQVLANRLQLCLVLTHDRAVYFEPDGGCVSSGEPPLGGHLVTDKLALTVACDDGVEELRIRQARLTEVIEQTRGGGFLHGDLTKGGHAATDEERQRLDGYLPDGTPRGLTRCVVCGQWRGICLDPSPRFVGRVMTVHCACDNHHRCARCLEPLFTHRLNSNYYDAARRIIFHVPGFCGLNHRCAQPESALLS